MGCAASTAETSAASRYAPEERGGSKKGGHHQDCAQCGGAGLFCLANNGKSHENLTLAETGGSHEERADRTYLMGVYDSGSLLYDLLCYVKHGTLLTLLPEETQGVFRLIGPGVALSSAHQTTDASTTTFQLTTKTGPRVTVSTPVSRVVEIILGPRHAAEQTAQEAWGTAHLKTFTLVFEGGKDGGGDGKDGGGEGGGGCADNPCPYFQGSMTLGSRSTQELEAWVIALASVTGVPPVWASSLDVSVCEGYAQLDVVERAACSSHNIPPMLYVKVQGFVTKKATEVQQCTRRSEAKKVMCGVRTPVLRGNRGSLRLSKGELRYWTGVDIFRTSIMWMLLARKNLIFDDAFRLATPPVPLYTLWFWSQASHAHGSSSLKHIIKAVLLSQMVPRNPALFLPSDLLTIVFTFLPLYP